MKITDVLNRFMKSHYAILIPHLVLLSIGYLWLIGWPIC